ncbi:ABC transporter ATP-binding protein [Methyloligella sp. GL2]|uniref:ABC transporter ATP-binding protein n=1 Tax=unclassified Methyloligella TaxID=2625955 RepID=UPI001FEF1B1D|nr:ABC transporter ATP-binding protein [Methyloligella sp. GL2]
MSGTLADKTADRGKSVEIKAVSKRFGSFEALKTVSFDIYDNEFFTLLGPSGCGKTTLLRMIAGFERPTGGDIALKGKNIDSLPPHKRRVNTVFQSYALFPHMTLEENIGFGLQNLGWDKERQRERVWQMLQMVHMQEFRLRKPTQLSGGQRQRIALARALAPEPEVLLLDEPLSALDLKLRQAMRNELQALQRQTGITFIFVTHDQQEAMDMSDRICVLGDGQVQQLGTPREIYEDPANRFVADFIGESNFLAVNVLSVAGDKAKVRTPFGFDIEARQKAAQPKTRAMLSLRPEKITIGDRGAAATMEGEIIQQNYLGTHSQYVVRVGETDVLVTSANDRNDTMGYEVGETVSLGFDPASARVLGE